MDIVIAGGGVAGLEALLALRAMARDHTRLTLIAPDPDFSYRPLAVAEPFGLGHAHRVPLERFAADADAELVIDAVVGVDDEAREVRLRDGGSRPFEALIVAPGGRAVAGVKGATTWWPGGDAEPYGGLLRDIDEGYAKRIAIVVPPGAVWPLPAYELALMTAGEARAMGHDDVKITVVTPEREPLTLFGEQASKRSLRNCAGPASTSPRAPSRVAATAAWRWSPAASAWTSNASSRCRGSSDPRWRAWPATRRASCSPPTTAASGGRADVGGRRRHRLAGQVRRPRDPSGARGRRRRRTARGRDRARPRRASPARPADDRPAHAPAARPRRRGGSAALVAARQGRGRVPAALARGERSGAAGQRAAARG